MTPPPSAISGVPRSMPSGQNVFAQLGEVREILGLLAGRQHDFVMRDLGLIERRGQRRQMQRSDVGIGDDHRAPLANHGRDQRAGARQKAAADMNVVAVAVERHTQGRGGAHGDTAAMPASGCAAT